jgi:hypothetical protein
MAEKTSPAVEIKSDQVTESFGNNAYVETLSLVEQQRRRVNLISIVVVVGVIGFSFTHTQERKAGSSDDHPLPTDINSSETLPLDSRIFTERDLTSPQPKPKNTFQAPAKIQIISLSQKSDLPIGLEIPAILASGATDGLVKAKLNAPVIYDGEPILPKASTLIGRGKSGDERLYVEFSKAILPSGESIPVRAQAFDSSDRIQGLKGAVVGKRTKKMAGAIAFGLMGGLASGLQETGGSIYMPRRPSARDAAFGGASKAALDQSKAFIEEMKNSPNIIEVKSGQEILVIVDEPKTKNSGE